MIETEISHVPGIQFAIPYDPLDNGNVLADGAGSVTRLSLQPSFDNTSTTLSRGVLPNSTTITTTTEV